MNEPTPLSIRAAASANGTRQPPVADPRLRRRAEWVLMLITAVWGTTFLASQDAMATWPPLWLLAGRFAVASAVLIPVALLSGTRRREPTATVGTVAMLMPSALTTPARAPHVWVRGAWLGAWAFGGFTLQTYSLHHTSAAHTAFGTCVVTILVPALSFVVWRRPLHGATAMAMLAAATGLALLFSTTVQPTASRGDVLAVACALAFAVQVMLLEHSAHLTAGNPRAVVHLVAAEVTTVMVLCVMAGICTGTPLPWPPTVTGISRVVYLGLIATAGCMLGQVYGQARTTATRAAFVYALEPVFAALFAWLLRGETMVGVELLGGSLIVVAALIADRPWRISAPGDAA